MSAPRVGHCVFSDDIRHEVGGKISLIGIYRGDIIFPTSPPIIYPKLCASVWLIAEPDDIPNEIHVSVLAPDQTEIARLDIQDMERPEIDEGAQKSIISIAIVMSPVVFSKEGYLEVWLETEREKIRVGRLRVSFKKPADDDQQPAT